MIKKVILVFIKYLSNIDISKIFLRFINFFNLLLQLLNILLYDFEIIIKKMWIFYNFWKFVILLLEP